MLLNSIPFLPPTCRLISGRHLLPSFCVSLCRPSSHQQQGRRRKNSLFGSCLGSFSTREHLDGATYNAGGREGKREKKFWYTFLKGRVVFVLFFVCYPCVCSAPKCPQGRGGERGRNSNGLSPSCASVGCTQHSSPVQRFGAING